MSNKGDPNKNELTLSADRSLAIKRSDLVKRGLELIYEVEKRRVEVPTGREKEAIKNIITHCEADYLCDACMFGSEADFYVFLHVEVRWLAKRGRIDFERAKEAYIFWAKKYHPAEYDRVNTPTDYNKQILEYMITKCKKIKLSPMSLQSIMQKLEGDWSR